MSTSASYVLRSMSAPDADAVQALWRCRFGGAPDTQANWIDAALQPTHTAVGTVAAVEGTDEPVAFGLLDVAGPDYTRRYLSADALGLDPALPAARNGVFHMYCVRPDWEGRGIGSALYADHLERLAERGVPRAFGISWHRPHTVDSRVLFEKHGFTCLATVERFYDRFEERPHCPDCDGPCTCTASLYTRALKTA